MQLLWGSCTCVHGQLCFDCDGQRAVLCEQGIRGVKLVIVPFFTDAFDEPLNRFLVILERALG